MTHFPDSDYAHCPNCGAHFGMGLACGEGKVFVLCHCGVRGPGVNRSDFESNGSIDVSAMDSAARHAWNMRTGSNGVPEIQAKIIEATGRMLKSRKAFGKVSSGFFNELTRWVSLLEMATDQSVGDF